MIKHNRNLFQLHSIIKLMFSSAAMLFDSIFIFEKMGFETLLVYGAVFSFFFAAGNIPLAKYSHKINPKTVTVLGVLGEILVCYLFLNYFAVETIYLIAAVNGLAIAATTLGITLLMSHSFEEDKMGKQNAWYGNLKSIVFSCAPLFGGLLIQNSGYDLLFKVLVMGYVISLIPLIFYNSKFSMVGANPPKCSLIKDFIFLKKEYNFRSDVFRSIIDEFDIELYLSFVLILMFLVGGEHHAVLGLILTISGLISIPIRNILGKRFDNGNVALPVSSGVLTSVAYTLFIVTLAHPNINTVVKTFSNVASLPMNFIASTQFTSNVKKYSDKQYAPLILAIGVSFGILLYFLIWLIYLLTGKDVMLTLYLGSASTVIFPLLKVFVYNKQSKFK